MDKNEITEIAHDSKTGDPVEVVQDAQDTTAAIIDEEISKIIQTALEKARELLSKNKKLLDNMARLLIERETIFQEEVDMLMEGKSVEEIMAFMDKNEKDLQENPFERNSKKSVIIKEEKALEKQEQSQEKTELEDKK